MEAKPCPVCGAQPRDGCGGDPWWLPFVLTCHGAVSGPTRADAVAAWNSLVAPHPKEVCVREDREVREARREDRDPKGVGGAP